MRIYHPRSIFTHRPYQGQGVSVYASAGAGVQYRKVRLLLPVGGWPFAELAPLIHQGSEIDWSGPTFPKSPRLASAAGTAEDDLNINATLPAALYPGTVSLDVRHYRDDVEWDGTGSHQTIEVDAGGDPVADVLGGSAEMLAAEVRTGGIVRLRFRYTAPTDGKASPATFTITFTAGPTSPSDIMLTFASGQSLYEADTGVLDDSAPYTIDLIANGDGDPLTLVSGFQFTANGTGPVAPLITSTEAV